MVLSHAFATIFHFRICSIYRCFHKMKRCVPKIFLLRSCLLYR